MNNFDIKKISAESVSDSRGNPTVSATVFSEEHRASFSVPSGASDGIHEAVELRDSNGGVSIALDVIHNTIAKELIGFDVRDQKKIDQKLNSLDGTKNKSVLGGNSILAVSGAVARLASVINGEPLFKHLSSLSVCGQLGFPRLFVNLINGGKHAKGGSVIQEHQIVTRGVNVLEEIELGKKIQESLRNVLKEKHIEFGMGDEGGFVFATEDVFESFDLLNQAVEKADAKKLVDIGSDVAASTFFENNKYNVMGDTYNNDNMHDLYERLHIEYNLKFVEDPFSEEDFSNFARLKRNDEFFVIGDDLTTTSKDRIQVAIDNKSIDAVIIKPNQIGTVSETIEAIEKAKEHNIDCIVSHRSGDTPDDFIADLACAFNCFGIKTGAFGYLERDTKYNRLIDIFKNYGI
jgi:enolase